MEQNVCSEPPQTTKSMSKVLISMMVTLDGFYEDPNTETDCQGADGQSNENDIGPPDTVDTLLFRRVPRRRRDGEAGASGEDCFRLSGLAVAGVYPSPRVLR